MAILGQEKLAAVNEILEAINETPVTSLGGPGEIHTDAENVLDRMNIRIQSWGWPENLQENVTSPSPSGGIITMASSTLAVRAVGVDRHRSISLRLDKLYEGAPSSSISGFGTSTVQLDVVEKLSFDDCTPLLKDAIIAAASVTFQRRKKGSLQQDAYLQQEFMRAVVVVDATRREPIYQNGPPTWHTPLLPLPGSSGGESANAR